MNEFSNPADESSAVPSPESPLQHETIAPSRPEPWSVWATLGWAILVGVVFSIAQSVVVAIFTVLAVRDNPRVDAMQLIKSLESNGFLLSVAVCASSLVGAGLTVLAARMRWPGTVSAATVPTATIGMSELPASSVASSPAASPTVESSTYTWREYLALCPVSARTLLTWMGILCLFAIASDTVTYLSGRPIVPEFMQKAYATAHIVPLLWIAFIIFAPVFEELFFRGFLFRGLADSKLGAAGAIVVTSLLWAAIHLQYDAYGMFSVFVAGLLLGWARVRTASIYPAIAMHCLMNFIATVEAALQHSGLLKIT